MGTKPDLIDAYAEFYGSDKAERVATLFDDITDVRPVTADGEVNNPLLDFLRQELGDEEVEKILEKKANGQ